jgi:hypothetical protein
VFTNIVGGYLDADNLRHQGFTKLLEKACVPRVRFHDPERNIRAFNNVLE